MGSTSAGGVANVMPASSLQSSAGIGNDRAAADDPIDDKAPLRTGR
jgi:hypothetical protein